MVHMVVVCLAVWNYFNQNDLTKLSYKMELRLMKLISETEFS